MDAWETQIGDATGVAVAEAIKHNATLNSFSMDARETQIGDATGVAMADAIKQNATLQSFSIKAVATEIGNATGVAMAEAIKQNATLQSFSIGAAAAQIGDATLCKDCRSRPCYSDKSELGRVLCFCGQRTGLVALGFCCLSRPLSSRRLR